MDIGGGTSAEADGDAVLQAVGGFAEHLGQEARSVAGGIVIEEDPAPVGAAAVGCTQPVGEHFGSWVLGAEHPGEPLVGDGFVGQRDVDGVD